MNNEITYDLILKYLVGDNINNFDNVNNSINVQSDILKSHYEYKEYFPYKKIGVNKDNSLISSILYLLEDNYKLLSNEEQINTNNTFLKQLKNKWINLSKGKNIPDNLLQIICDVLVLNIIILDFESNKFNIESGSDKINTLRGFVLISKFKNNYEPVIDNDKKIFSLLDLHKDVRQIIEEKSYTTEELLKLEGYKDIKDSNFKVNLDDYNKSKLNKMKKNQLLNILEMLKINVNEKETKNNIIELILSQK